MSPAFDRFCQLGDDIAVLIQCRKERTMQIIELRTKGGMKFKLGEGLSNFEDRVLSIERPEFPDSSYVVKTSEGHQWIIPDLSIELHVEGNVEAVKKVEAEYERSADDGGVE